MCRIFVTSSYGYWGEYTRDDILGRGKQVGGGEHAMMSLAFEWAHLGHEVVLFYGNSELGKIRGVDFLPMNLFVSVACAMDHDVLVSWDAPHAFRFSDRAKKHIIAFQLNDAFIGSMDWVIDYYVHPSAWHANRFAGMYPEMNRDKIVSGITNGIKFERFTGPDFVEYNPHRVIYSSSPDRGLHHLLLMWDDIISDVNDAHLDVFYDIERWIENTKKFPMSEEMLMRAEVVEGFLRGNHPSITFHGGVSQSTLTGFQKASGLLVYPCDPVQPTEGFSMTILEGLTAGCTVITSNADALQEIWGTSGAKILPLPVHAPTWVKVITDEMKCKSENVLVRNRELQWETIARRWEALFGVGG